MRDFISSNNFRYLAPFIAFMLLTSLQGYFEGTELFLVYGFKNIVTLVLLVYCFKNYKSEITGSFNFSSILFGTLAFIVWILLGENLGPLISSERTASFLPQEFNISGLSSSLNLYLAITIRTLGAVCVVPIMEELVWRSWLMRWLINEKFTDIEIGTYSSKSFWLTVIFFASVHHVADIPGALLVGILYGYQVIKYKNIWSVIGSHAVTNLLLAIYIIYTGKYYYW